MRGLFLILVASLSFKPLAAAANEDICGSKKITIAEMTWLSAGALAQTFKTILETGYQCKVTMLPGDTVPTTSSLLSKGKPDIVPELWPNSVKPQLDKIIKKGIAYSAGSVFKDGGNEGFFIPGYLAEKYPDLKSVADLPRYAEMFKVRGSRGKGRILGCPPGWACEITTANVVKALGLEQNFELYSPGSGANLKASIARAATRKKPVLTYYWGPTAVIGRYNLVKLDMPPYDEKAFQCISDPDCASPQPTDFPSSDVLLMVTSKLKQRAPKVAELMSKIQVPNNVINDALAWGDENSASTADIAQYLLKNNPEMWHAWVSAEAKSRIEAALAD